MPSPGPDLHERIAAALGWTVEETQGFSLATLREILRPKHPALAEEIADVIERGAHIYVPVKPPRRWR